MNSKKGASKNKGKKKSGEIKSNKFKKTNKKSTKPKKRSFLSILRLEDLNKKKVIINSVIWIVLFSWIFYKGSKNVGIWGKWQGFEIVFPTILSFVSSGIIVLIILFIESFFEKLIKKKFGNLKKV